MLLDRNIHVGVDGKEKERVRVMERERVRVMERERERVVEMERCVSARER